MIERCIANNLRKTLESGKAVVLLGPRQVGKSTLSKMLLESREGVKWFTGDDPADREALTNLSLNKLKLIIGTSETVVIDEAQKISGIGGDNEAYNGPSSRGSASGHRQLIVPAYF